MASFTEYVWQNFSAYPPRITFKKIVEYVIAPLLVIGSSITLGFLCFSGIWILLPILPLAIAGFWLSIGYEGEIIYKNIQQAIYNFLNPNYVKEQLAKECLVEINSELQEIFQCLDKVNELNKKIKSLNHSNLDIESEISDCKILYAEIRSSINKKNTSWKKTLSYSELNLPNEEDFYNELTSLHKNTNQKLTIPGYLQIKDGEFIGFIEKYTTNVSDDILSRANNNIPNFFKCYINLLILNNKFSDTNLKPQSEIARNKSDISLSILEKEFAQILFSKTGSESKNNIKQNDNIQNFKSELNSFLAIHYQDEWQKKILQRTRLNNIAKTFGAISGIFMALGTSYLLVEAFSIIPVISALSMSMLPAVIIPMSIIAGVAFVIVTYNAIDNLIKDDLLQKRATAIITDIKNNPSIYNLSKAFFFTAIFTLAITLTIFTAGTWLTILRHSRSLFSWIGKMPAAFAAVIAGVLGLAALAFNITNSVNTADELIEYAESESDKNHPLHVTLIKANSEDNKKYKVGQNLILIKKADKYYINDKREKSNKRNTSNLTYQENDANIKIAENAYFSLFILNRIDFNFNGEKSELHYSIKNLALYLVISLNNTLKNKDKTWGQFFNPFRIFLAVTYAPLRTLLFIGHLLSICATSDQVEGIEQFLSAFIGFIAELFEDLLYFVHFEHAHNHDIASLTEARAKGKSEHEHNNDLPTRFLRDFLFYSIFCLSAKWEVIFDKDTPNYFKYKEKNPKANYLSYLYFLLVENAEQKEHYENSLHTEMEIGIKEDITLTESENKILAELPDNMEEDENIFQPNKHTDTLLKALAVESNADLHSFWSKSQAHSRLCSSISCTPREATQSSRSRYVMA